MSNEPGQSDQQQLAELQGYLDQQRQAREQAPKWGDAISPERQAELQGYLDQWQAETDHGDRKGAFDHIELAGADVYWLAEQRRRGESNFVPFLHLEGADLDGPGRT